MSLSTKLIIAGTLILLVVILIGIYASYHTFTQVFTQMDETIGYWLTLTIVLILAALCVAVLAALVLGVWFLVVEIQGRRQKHNRFAPTEQGYYEALLVQNQSGQQLFIKPADNVPLLVPTTYSPRIELHTQPSLPAALPQSLSPLAAYEQPLLETILEELTPNALEFAYGLEPESGDIIKTTLPKAVHIQLIGGTNMGKSHQATSIMTQLTSRNDPTHLQLALVDYEGETTAPFQKFPHVKYLADEPKEAARVFRGLVQELERRDISRLAFPVILIFAEEFLNLRRTIPSDFRDQALEDYTTLALRGRKRGMYLFSIGQTAYTEKAIRDAQAMFFSSMAFAIKPSTARSAGFTNTDLLNRLYKERRPGQFLLERPTGDSLLLAPYVDYRTIPTLLESAKDTNPNVSIIETDWKPIGKPTETTTRNPIDAALQANTEQVIRLLQQGVTNKTDILLSVWGIRPGRSEKYRQAEEEYKQIMVYLAASQKQQAEVEA